MKLCIPELKTKMKLTTDWTFSLFPEARNKKLFELLEDNNILLESNITKTTEDIFDYEFGFNEKDPYKLYTKYFCKIGNIIKKDYDGYLISKDYGGYCELSPIGGPYCYKLILQKNTILIPDRYYIRNGSSEFSSVTFRVHNVQIPELKKYKLRFWAKLYEVNGIEFEAI